MSLRRGGPNTPALDRYGFGQNYGEPERRVYSPPSDEEPRPWVPIWEVQPVRGKLPTNPLLKAGLEVDDETVWSTGAPYEYPPFRGGPKRPASPASVSAKAAPPLRSAVPAVRKAVPAAGGGPLPYDFGTNRWKPPVDFPLVGLDYDISVDAVTGTSPKLATVLNHNLQAIITISLQEDNSHPLSPQQAYILPVLLRWFWTAAKFNGPNFNSAVRDSQIDTAIYASFTIQLAEVIESHVPVQAKPTSMSAPPAASAALPVVGRAMSTVVHVLPSDVKDAGIKIMRIFTAYERAADADKPALGRQLMTEVDALKPARIKINEAVKAANPNMLDDEQRKTWIDISYAVELVKQYFPYLCSSSTGAAPGHQYASSTTAHNLAHTPHVVPIAHATEELQRQNAHRKHYHRPRESWHDVLEQVAHEHLLAREQAREEVGVTHGLPWRPDGHCVQLVVKEIVVQQVHLVGKPAVTIASRHPLAQLEHKAQWNGECKAPRRAVSHKLDEQKEPPHYL